MSSLDEVRDAIQQFGKEQGGDREFLLPLLQRLNQHFHFLDYEIVNEVARFFKISQTEVFSVASFYHLLSVKPVGRHVIRLCRTVSCELAGRKRIQKVLEAELGIQMGETTPDGIFTLDYANCMGMCDKGPAMMVDNDLYAQLTPTQAVEILHSYRNR